MGQVTLTLNGRCYRVGCGDGQEERLGALAAHFGAKLEEVVREFGHVGEARLFLLTGLLIADELFDARAARDTAASNAAAAALREIAERAKPEMGRPSVEARPAQPDAAPAAPAPPLAKIAEQLVAPPVRSAPDAASRAVTAPATKAASEPAAPLPAKPEEPAKSPASPLQAAINRAAPAEPRKSGAA